MAEEPSWEDIFNPNPTPREPVAPTPDPLVEPPQAYPPAQAHPPQPPPAAAPPVAVQPVVPPAEKDPFAALFGTSSAPLHAAQPQPSVPLDAQPVTQYPPTQQAFPASQQYPPTQAYPTQEQQFAAPAGSLPAQPVPAQAAPAQPVSAQPVSAEPAEPLAAQPVAAQPVAQPAPVQPDDPFAGLFGTPQPATPAPVVQPPHEYTPDLPFPTTATARFTPREDDDPFAALFGASAEPAPELAARASGADAPVSRRDAREGDGRRRGADSDIAHGGGSGGRGGRDGYGGSGNGKPRKKRSLLWLKITLPIVIVLALVGGTAAYGWFNYNEQVRALLGIPLPTDFTGDGNGKEVIVTIKSGDIGEDIAHTLHDKGVTMTFDAFYNLLLKQKTDPAFQPGNFKLQEHMSAKAALKALLDPGTKVTDKLLITEGTTLPDALQTIADTTGIALADLQAASKDLASLNVPTTEPSLEGYLFPATYQLDGGQTAHDVLQLLVNTMYEHLDAAGVAVDQRHNVLTLASIIQRESGPNTDDFYKISRVFTNRMEQGINLESDATVAYGTGHLNTVYTTDAERADASNPYNTYANPGYPVGPIGLPGDTAIDAALHPADGPWLFFVPINLQTGETVFSETVDEHDAAVEQLNEWCAASPENDSYCQ